MRWIVISLLLINALILGWRWFAASEPATPPATRSVTTPAIELLPEGAVRPMQREAPATVVEATPAAATAESAESALLAPTEPTSEIEAEFALTSDASAVSASPDGMAAAPGAVASGADLSPTTPPTAASSLPSAQCAWTPWRERPLTELDTAELVHSEQQEQEIGRSYLVYIPAKASREQTLQRLSELKAEGIDAAYLNKGPQAGGISLGLFSKPESMQLRLRELKKADIADVSGIERIRTEPRIRQLLRWTGEKTPSSVQNQALVSCNDIAPTPAGQ